MQEHTGNTSARAMAWVRRIMLSLSPQAELGKNIQKFTERRRPLFDGGQPPDVSTRRQRETFLQHNLEKVYIPRGYQAEKISRRLGARALTFKGQFSGNRLNLDSATTKGLGLLDNQPVRAVQQAQSQKLPQRQLANRDFNLAPAALTRTHSDVGMVLPAPAENTPLIPDLQRRETQHRASEQPGVEGPAEKRTESTPRIDAGEVADRVYRLMQHDLRLEKERATKFGG